MSVIGSFQGASILAFPSTPAVKQLQLTKKDTVAVSTSPFTGASQYQVWPGADWWLADLTLPQMTRQYAAAWSAFLGECRGSLNCFYVGDPSRSQPQGTPKGTPVVFGVNAPMATVLNTKGWTPNSYRLLLPGDLLQIGMRLHEVLSQVNSDGSGNAAISIWPSIREATTDGEAIVLSNPKGLFRLADNARSVLTDETRLYGVNFKLVEAR